MIIGNFQSADDGFAGQIRTLLLDAMIAIVPAQPSAAENAPAWRVLLVEADTGIEIGAGWERRGERAGSYIALQIDDPALGAPISANLLRSTQNEDEYHLLWSRPVPRDKA
ncbi:DUF736 domain-containing protein [Sphingopyxis sp. DBS4]|uniref:DUF736 domain-containing protein n=1 Tax=Sphingopyxis sp. DBS4 TaxID=2968500 RepID=UPI00214B1393|nr:DUF736 domain-containing protein [Sphingopyxis sp. DBS4]